MENLIVGIIGSGAMGSGIAQVAASAGHKVWVYDNDASQLKKAAQALSNVIQKLIEKGKLTVEQGQAIGSSVTFTNQLEDFKLCGLIIEAIVENLQIKQSVFSEIEKIISDDCLLASNTSSLSIASIAAECSNAERVLGIHFFNPAPLMPLVEIIPGISTSPENTIKAKNIIDAWNKITVLCKDTPGFIVNRVARSFYGEAIRIAEEGIADYATIDWAIKTYGNFKMGPFELMDFIGSDVNYKVTESVWQQFFYDPRFKPSLTQKRLYESKRFGKKSGKGYYDYTTQKTPQPIQDEKIGKEIFERILCMLINEAVDTYYLKIASAKDIDLAMTKGVNYPQGLLTWGQTWGWDNVHQKLNNLYTLYEEDRYRSCILLKRLASGTEIIKY
ncbi:MAG: NAD(P)-binding domain-containing protein [Bacteroidia bacterium]|nr:NAD(P)-binding domain-containing protein [Bacteroidia bacterium]